MDPLVLGAAALGIMAGFLVGLLVSRSRERTRQERLKAAAEDDSSRILSRAEDEADTLRKAGEIEGKQVVIQSR